MANSFVLSSLRPALASVIALATGLLPVSTIATEPPAAQFGHAPRLVRTGTDTLAATRVSGTTYTFTLTVPQNAGAALQAVTVTQEGNLSPIEFEVNQSRAFAADGTRVPLASVGGVAGKETTIAFAQPIQPGKTVTIALKADRSPDTAGVYSFGITAYPVGNSQKGLSLGYGRVTVYGYGR